MTDLDNPAWHALAGPQGQLGTVGERAGRFRADVSPIAGIADESDAALDELAGMFEPREFCAVFVCGDAERSPSWRLATTVTLSQWVCPEPPVPSDGAPAFIELDGSRAQEMYDLVKATDPGPFEMQTWRFGDYIGIDVAGKLVSMTGERLAFAGHREVSAVCTLPEHAGNGYARALVREIARRQHAAGALPFLHVRTGSPSERSAIRVYESLGFVKRADLAMKILVRL